VYRIAEIRENKGKKVGLARGSSFCRSFFSEKRMVIERKEVFLVINVKGRFHDPFCERRGRR